MINFKIAKKDGIILNELEDTMDDIKINDIIKVVVTGIQKYGAFVLINDFPDCYSDYNSSNNYKHKYCKNKKVT